MRALTTPEVSKYETLVGIPVLGSTSMASCCSSVSCPRLPPVMFVALFSVENASPARSEESEPG